MAGACACVTSCFVARGCKTHAIIRRSPGTITIHLRLPRRVGSSRIVAKKCEKDSALLSAQATFCPVWEFVGQQTQSDQSHFLRNRCHVVCVDNHEGFLLVAKAGFDSCYGMSRPCSLMRPRGMRTRAPLGTAGWMDPSGLGLVDASNSTPKSSAQNESAEPRTLLFWQCRLRYRSTKHNGVDTGL